MKLLLCGRVVRVYSVVRPINYSNVEKAVLSVEKAVLSVENPKTIIKVGI